MLNYLGLNDWIVIESDDPWCQWSKKILFVFPNDPQCLLHEATHALIGGRHLKHFWVLFEAMADYFLGEELNKMQTKMKNDYL